MMERLNRLQTPSTLYHPGQRYATMYSMGARRLETLTQEERDFLSIFRGTDGGEPPWGAGNVMPREVYGAGEALVRDRFLTKTTLEGSVERFALPEPIISAWSWHGSVGPLARGTADLDLKKVQGTGASGGGARGVRWSG